MSDTAAVIAVASSKGGCGKSTTVLILAGEYAAQGYTVHIIDADPKARLFRWAGFDAKPDSITASQADEKNIREEIERARKAADVVLIDVEGSANAALTFAIGYADAVVVPATHSPPDVEDAIGTVKLVRDMGAVARREIPHGLLWSNVPAAIRSRESAALEAQVEEGGIPVIGRVFSRTAFKSLFSFTTTLDQLPPAEVPGLDKAKADAVALATAVEKLMNSHGTVTEAAE